MLSRVTPIAPPHSHSYDYDLTTQEEYVIPPNILSTNIETMV